MARKKVNVPHEVLVEEPEPKAPEPEPAVVDDGQARADRATHIMLMDMFWPKPPKRVGGRNNPSL